MNLEQFKIKSFQGVKPIMFLALVLMMIVSVSFGKVPGNMVGALAFLFVFGALFGEIGNRIPFWNKYIGGGAILVFFVAAFIGTYGVAGGWFPENIVVLVDNFYGEWDFIDLFITILIVGSILGVDRKLLAISLGGYIPAILGAVGLASVFGVGVAFIFGIDGVTALTKYVLPIMGGGTGAGAIPMSEMYAAATGGDPKAWFGFAIAILTIANIFAIVVASSLNALGKKRPELTGNGELIRAKESVVKDEATTGEKYKVTHKDYAAGLMFATTLYVFANYLSKTDIMTKFTDATGVAIHRYAILVIMVAIFNLANLVPQELKEGAKSLSKFFSGQFLWVLMAAVGMGTDLTEIAAAISVANLFIALAVVIGAGLGGALVGRLFGFYPIESAITAGLCMANRGGSGDIAVLGAADRMDLISYAQISSRIGGALILIIASVCFGIFL